MITSYSMGCSCKPFPSCSFVTTSSRFYCVLSWPRAKGSCKPGQAGDRLNMTQSTKMERGFVFLGSHRLLSLSIFCDCGVVTCIWLAYDLHMMHSCPGSLAPMGWPKACATWAQWQWASTASTVTNFQEKQCKSKARAVFVLPEKHGTRRKIMSERVRQSKIYHYKWWYM